MTVHLAPDALHGLNAAFDTGAMLGERLERLLHELDENPLALHLSVEPFRTRPLFRLAVQGPAGTWSLLWTLRADGEAFVVDISPDRPR